MRGLRLYASDKFRMDVPSEKRRVIPSEIITTACPWGLRDEACAFPAAGKRVAKQLTEKLTDGSNLTVLVCVPRIVGPQRVYVHYGRNYCPSVVSMVRPIRVF